MTGINTGVNKELIGSYTLFQKTPESTWQRVLNRKLNKRIVNIKRATPDSTEAFGVPVPVPVPLDLGDFTLVKNSRQTGL